MKPVTAQVLRALRSAGSRGACTAELCQPAVGGARFGARILELRDAGCQIDGRRERAGSHRYWLRSEPDGLLLPPSTTPTPTPSAADASPAEAAEGDGAQLALGLVA